MGEVDASRGGCRHEVGDVVLKKADASMERCR